MGLGSVQEKWHISRPYPIVASSHSLSNTPSGPVNASTHSLTGALTGVKGTSSPYEGAGAELLILPQIKSSQEGMGLWGANRRSVDPPATDYPPQLEGLVLTSELQSCPTPLIC